MRTEPSIETANQVLEAMRCRNLVDFGRPPPVAPRPERPAPAKAELEVIGKPILAHRRGICGICHARIWEGNDEEMGDEIVQVLGRGWCHRFCAPDEEDEPERDAYATSGVSWPE